MVRRHAHEMHAALGPRGALPLADRRLEHAPRHFRPDQSHEVAHGIAGQRIAEHGQGIAEAIDAPAVLQLRQKLVRHARRIGVEHVVERHCRRPSVALAIGGQIRSELRRARLGHLLAQDEAHLLHQMPLHDGVPVQPALVGLAQQHGVVDGALDDRAALLLGQRPAEQGRLIVHERVDAGPVDHERLLFGRHQQVVGHEQERGERQEMDERLAPERVPETSEHRVGGTSPDEAHAIAEHGSLAKATHADGWQGTWCDHGCASTGARPRQRALRRAPCPSPQSCLTYACAGPARRRKRARSERWQVTSGHGQAASTSSTR